MTKVGESIQKIAKSVVKTQTIRGVVKSVDKGDNTCVVMPIRGGADYLDVKLDSTINSQESKLIVYPAVESAVFITIVEDNTADTYVSKFGAVASILIELENNFKLDLNTNGNLTIDANQITINGGQLGGLVKVNELVNQLTKVNTILQNIKTAFTTWIVAPSDGGAALKALSTSFTALPTADLTNLANNDITQ